MSRNFDLLQEMEQSRAVPIEEIAGPAASSFPQENEGEHRDPSAQSAADGTLRLVQSIFLLQAQTPPRVVVFAGVDHRNGCSRITAAAAASLASSGRGSVCLVEANFRSPGLPAMLGMTNHHGLTDALLQEGEIRSFVKPVRSAAQFSLLSSGALAADSPKLLNSDRLKDRIGELRREFGFVLIDAPPLMRYPDAISLGQLSDGLVLILEADATRREAAQVIMENLNAAKIPVLAAVLNKRTYPIPEAIYKRL